MKHDLGAFTQRWNGLSSSYNGIQGGADFQRATWAYQFFNITALGEKRPFSHGVRPPSR
jgi:hypothetical protein